MKGKNMFKVPSIEEMLKAGMHFGHRTSKWHPKMEPFIFTQRNGVHIINLVKSQKMLQSALEFIENMTAEGKVILFIGTKPQVKEPLKKMSEETQVPYVVGKWLGGCITNFAIIRKSIRRYMDLVKQREEGKLKKYTKKEQLDFDHEIERLEMKVGGLVSLTKTPDVVFVWDVKKEKTAIAEAKKKNIPVIAVCDTNVNPKDINYIIPSNDDATKTIKLVLNAVKEAIVSGQSRREQTDKKAKK